MSLQLHDDDVVARLRAGAPGYPEAGPDAGRTLTAARRALRRRRGRRALAGVAAVVALIVGLTAAGPISVPGLGTSVLPGGPDSYSDPSQGDPPVYPRERLLTDIANLERYVLPVAEDLGVSFYLDRDAWQGGPECDGFTWSRGAFRDRDPGCANPDDPELPFDAASDAAFVRVSDAIELANVNVFRIGKGGGRPGTSFHLRDNSIMWNWYYSYVPGTSAGAQEEIRTETSLGPRLQVHVTGDWWFTVEPDD